MALDQLKQMDSSRTRRAFLVGSATLDFPSITGPNTSDLTITVKGAALGDPVLLGAPNASVGATGSFFAFVSAADTVTVRASLLAGTVDEASGVFNVVVLK